MNATALALLSLGPLLLGAVLGVMLDAFASRRAALAVVLFGFALSAAFSIVGVAGKVAATSVWGVLHAGGVFATIAAVVAVVGGLAVLGGWSDLSERDSGGTLAGLMAFAAAASIVVASSRDVTLLLIALETAAACAYALVAAGSSARAREAAMKYFLQGAIATGFFVFGMAVLVAVFIPTGDMDALPTALAASPLPISVAAAGIVLLLAALAFKAGAAPFHSWAPDAYESAAHESAAFLSAGPKLGAVSALAVLATFAASGTADRLVLPLVAVLALLAIVSVTVGSLAALRQSSYTRMLGYAGIAQVGYALIGVAVTKAPLVPIFFTATYALAATGTFLAASAFRRIDPDWDGTVAGLAGMSRKAPWVSAGTSVLVISLAGIPPLLGFWAKLTVFVAALGAASNAFVSGGQAVVGWICAVAAAVGIVGSVVSLGYYGSVLRALYQTPPAPRDESAPESGADADGTPKSGGSAAFAVVAIAALTMLFGLAPLLRGIDSIWYLFH